MEKVKAKLTAEQEKALKYAVADYGSDNVIDNHGSWGNKLSSLNDLRYSELSRALYVGYEVEPEYSVDDWIVFKEEHIGKIEVVDEGDLYTDIKNANGVKQVFLDHGISGVRHATPAEIKQEKERRWWASHGRGVWELKVGDILRDAAYNLYSVTNISDLNVFVDGEPHQKGTTKNLYTVVCFLENRLDVSVSE